MRGNACIGCISDSDPQPILIRSHLGTYAITVVGCINNAQALIEEFLASGRGHFEAHTGGKINATELTAALSTKRKPSRREFASHRKKSKVPCVS